MKRAQYTVLVKNTLIVTSKNNNIIINSSSIIDTTFYEEFFEQQGVPENMARFYLCSLLQKGARSGCIYKNELIMKRIMTARNILGYNMYHSKLIQRSKKTEY
jgi:hypothetical protein